MNNLRLCKVTWESSSLNVVPAEITCFSFPSEKANTVLLLFMSIETTHAAEPALPLDSTGCQSRIRSRNNPSLKCLQLQSELSTVNHQQQLPVRLRGFSDSHNRYKQVPKDRKSKSRAETKEKNTSETVPSTVTRTQASGTAIKDKAKCLGRGVEGSERTWEVWSRVPGEILAGTTEQWVSKATGRALGELGWVSEVGC